MTRLFQHRYGPLWLLLLIFLGVALLTRTALLLKTGKGFYDYSVKPAIANPQLRHPVA